MPSLLRAALQYAELGLHVFPVHGMRDGCCTCGRGDCERPGKHPRAGRGHLDATTDPDQIESWWRRWPDSNIGCSCPASGLVAIDVDPRNGGDETWRDLAGSLEPSSLETWHALTGGGGDHFLFRAPTDQQVQDGAGKLGPGVDVKANGYVVLAPSSHASGRTYQWEIGAAPWERPLLELPAPLLARLTAKLPKTTPSGRETKQEALLEGQRNDGLFSSACRMRRIGLSQAAIEAALFQENLERCSPLLHEDEVRQIAASAAQYEPAAGAVKQNAPASLGVVPLSQLLEEPEEEVAFVWDQTLPTGGLSFIVAKPKVGKSTLARNLALAVSRGDDFLGRGTLQGPVVYLGLEEKRAEVRSHFVRMGASSEPVYVSVEPAPEEALGALTAEIRAKGAVLAIVDPVAKFVRIRDFNDYAEVSRALEPLLALARETGCHIALVHHAGKSDRDAGDAVLGSTALYGAVDALVSMRRRENVRTIETRQRYGTDMESSVVSFEPDTGVISLGGKVEDVERDRVGAAILEVLSEDGMTEAEIRSRVEGRTTYVSSELRRLVVAGEVVRSGGGRRGDPFLYSRLLVPGNGGEQANENRERTPLPPLVEAALELDAVVVCDGGSEATGEGTVEQCVEEMVGLT